MLSFQVVIVLLTFIVASLLILSSGNAAVASYHVVFTIGIIPLVISVMLHFAPVLTRSRRPNGAITVLPIFSLFGGVLAIYHFVFPQVAPYSHYFGAAINMMVVVSLGYWMLRLRNNTIGMPHPCLDWYISALTCLFIALGTILMAYFIPEQRSALRLFHLHLNTLGFIGITALGTLQVLLPTTVQHNDPLVATRMRGHLKWVIIGTILIACGAAWNLDIIWIGLVLLAIRLSSILKSWWQFYAKEIVSLHGTTPVLAIAFCAYMVTIAIGTMHGYHYTLFNPVATFIIAFLMPLVTGAISHLLPLWLRPGKQTNWHQTARNHLGYGGSLRALLFLLGGIVVGVGYRLGWALAIVGSVLFISQVFYVGIKSRSSRKSTSRIPR